MRARDRAYHVECFRCSSCSRHLVPGDEYALDEERGLLCRTDHECFANVHKTRHKLTCGKDVEVYRDRDLPISSNQIAGNTRTPPSNCISSEQGKRPHKERKSHKSDVEAQSNKHSREEATVEQTNDVNNNHNKNNNNNGNNNNNNQLIAIIIVIFLFYL